jgi:hypothetical protein
VSSPVKVVELSFGEANSPKTNRIKSCPMIRFPSRLSNCWLPGGRPFQYAR